MNARLAAAGLLVIAACSSAAAASGFSAASKQRVAITVKASDHTFLLTPLARGALKPDSGSEEGCCWSQRFVMRDGQRIEINDPLVTFTGKHGTLQIRYRIEWVDAGHGYSVGTGSWHVVRGTGAYAHTAGSGRGGFSWPPGGFASQRSEGFLITR